jgi:iron complex outermembrane receptor protein
MLDPRCVLQLMKKHYAGYRLPSTGFLKAPTIRLNVLNLFNKNYLVANSGSGSNITTSIAAPSSQGGGFPTYFVGAPRFASITLSTEF